MTRIIKKSKRTEDGEYPVMKLTDIAEQAKEIILDARKTAARIKGEARANCELAKKQAYEQGYRQGLTQGREKGLADGARQAREEARTYAASQSKHLVAAAEEVIARLDETGRRPCQLAADEILSLAIEVSRKIVGRLARTDISVARTNLIKAMKLAQGGGEITVSVNPGQLQELSRDFSDFVEVIDGSAHASLAPDPEVAPGGVKIHTARGVIDAAVETQLDKVASALSDGGLACRPETPAKANSGPHLRIIDDDVSV